MFQTYKSNKKTNNKIPIANYYHEKKNYFHEDKYFFS